MPSVNITSKWKAASKTVLMIRFSMINDKIFGVDINVSWMVQTEPVCNHRVMSAGYIWSHHNLDSLLHERQLFD